MKDKDLSEQEADLLKRFKEEIENIKPCTPEFQKIIDDNIEDLFA